MRLLKIGVGYWTTGEKIEHMVHGGAGLGSDDAGGKLPMLAIMLLC